MACFIESRLISRSQMENNSSPVSFIDDWPSIVLSFLTWRLTFSVRNKFILFRDAKVRISFSGTSADMNRSACVAIISKSGYNKDIEQRSRISIQSKSRQNVIENLIREFRIRFSLMFCPYVKHYCSFVFDTLAQTLAPIFLIVSVLVGLAVSQRSSDRDLRRWRQWRPGCPSPRGARSGP